MDINNPAKSFLTSEDLERWKSFEGYSNHFYLDSNIDKTYVTIGIGCVIPDANAASRLSFYLKDTNIMATVPEKVNEYNIIKNSLPNKTLKYYERLCTLYMQDIMINYLFEVRISQLLDLIYHQLPEFLKMPKSVQNVVLDMAYNLGVSGLLMKFPKFCEYLRKFDYLNAATECERNGIQSERNLWARTTLLNALNVNKG